MQVFLRENIPSGYSHQERIHMANQIVALCLEKHGDKIATIGIYGSTSVGNDSPYSDLDMTIITYEDLSDFEKCYTFRGLPIVLDYCTREEAEREAANPAEGGCWMDFLPLYDPDDLVGKLRVLRGNLTDADYREAFIVKMRDDLSTLIGTVRNAVLLKNRAHFHWAAQHFGEEVCRALYILNRHDVTGQARLRDETKTLPVLPPDFSGLVDHVQGAIDVSDQETYDACEDLWKEMRHVAEENDLSWESDVLYV